MTIVVCHSPKGGVGTTFVAAQLAQMAALSGRSVTLLSTAPFGSPAPHLGKSAALALPALSERSLACAPGVIDLRRHRGGAGDPDLVYTLQELGFTGTSGERLLIVDVAAGQHALTMRLAPLAALRLCILSPAPDALVLLPDALEASDSLRDLFVLNVLDETRRIERHGAALARELLGERLLGRVRRDVSVLEAIASLQPLSAYAPASAALADLRALAGAVDERLAATKSEMPLPAPAVLAA